MLHEGLRQPMVYAVFAPMYPTQHETSCWNPDSFEVDTAEGTELASMLEADGEWNLLDPDFSQVQDTPQTKQSSQPVTASEVYTSLYNDSDSVSTFRVPSFSADASSVQPSVKHTPRIVSEVPTLFTNTVPSDTVSRMSSLEKRFQNFHTGLEELKYQAQ